MSLIARISTTGHRYIPLLRSVIWWSIETVESIKNFKTKLAQFWPNSTWGHQPLQTLEKLVIEEEDVDKTYAAMLDATSLLTEEVLLWSSRNTGRHPSQGT